MSHFEADLHDPVFRRLCIVVAACLVALVAGFMLTESAYLVFAATLALAYVATLTVNQKALAWLVIALQPAALIIPFFPGRPFFWELCALLSWPSLLAYFVINRPKLEVLRLDRIERGALLALLGYVAVLFVLMATRGVGLRTLGGDQMGGRMYAQQIVLSIVPILLISSELSSKKIWWAMVIGWILSTTYLIAELSFETGNPLIYRLLYFFELPVDGINFKFGAESSGLRRFGSLAPVSMAALSLLWISTPLRTLLGRWAWVGLPTMLGLLALGLLSGYRNALVLPITTLFFLTFIQRFWNPLRTIVACILLSGSVATAYLFADDFPPAIQRTITLLPGINVSEQAAWDAKTTNLDRLEVMKMAFDDLPNYWLLGRGFGMERLDQSFGDPSLQGTNLLYAQGMFYNGFIGGMIKTGLPGLTLTLLYTWYISRAALSLLKNIRSRSSSQWSPFDRLCALLAAYWFATATHYYLTNGDINGWVQNFGFTGALILHCRRLQLTDTPAVKFPR